MASERDNERHGVDTMDMVARAAERIALPQGFIRPMQDGHRVNITYLVEIGTWIHDGIRQPAYAFELSDASYAIELWGKTNPEGEWRSEVSRLYVGADCNIDELVSVLREYNVTYYVPEHEAGSLVASAMLDYA